MSRTPAEIARDEAIDQVRYGPSELWRLAAYPVVLSLADTQAEFTTDDIWKLMRTPPPPEPRAMGAVMADAARAGICVATERTQKSTRVECHARPIRIWKSLVYTPRSS